MKNLLALLTFVVILTSSCTHYLTPNLKPTDKFPKTAFLVEGDYYTRHSDSLCLQIQGDSVFFNGDRMFMAVKKHNSSFIDRVLFSSQNARMTYDFEIRRNSDGSFYLEAHSTEDAWSGYMIKRQNSNY